MADFSALAATTNYLTLLGQISDRDRDLAVGLDPAVVTVTGMPTNTIRYSSANKRWEKYNGSTWVELIAAATDAYAITVTGVRSGNFYGTITNNGTISGGTVNATTLQRAGNTVWDAANLTNLNQLANGPGYITGSGSTTGSSGSVVYGGSAAVDANADRGVGMRTIINSTSSTNWPSVAGVAIEARRSSGGASDAGTFQLWCENSATESLMFRKVTGFSGSDTWSAWRTLLHSGNVGTYALPIGGGTLTGSLLTSGGFVLSNTAPAASNAWFSTPVYATGQGDNRTHFGYWNGASYQNYIRGATTNIDSALVANAPVTINGIITINSTLSFGGNEFSFAGAGSPDVSAVRVFSFSNELYLQAGSGNKINFRAANGSMVGSWQTNTGNLSIGYGADQGWKLAVNGGQRLSGQSELIRLVHDNAFISFYESSNVDRTGYIQANNESFLYVMHEDLVGGLAFGTGGTTMWEINTSGTLYPSANGARNFGGTSNRIATGYFVDLNASGVISAAGASANIYQVAVGGTNYTDSTSGSPWYGIGRLTDNTLPGGVNPQVQVAGYGGLRLRSSGAVLDLYASGSAALSGGGINLMGGQNLLHDTSLVGGNPIGFRNVPLLPTTGQVATTGAIGKAYLTSGSMTFNDGVGFAGGDAVMVINSTGSAISIIPGGSLTLRLAGTTLTGTRTLAAYGIATVLYHSASVAVVTGAGVA